jgi:hypothetical protein
VLARCDLQSKIAFGAADISSYPAGFRCIVGRVILPRPARYDVLKSQRWAVGLLT